MNDLSWLIYLAEVASNLGTLLGVAGFIGTVGGLLCLPVFFVEHKGRRDTDGGRLTLNIMKFLFIGSAISLTVATLIPSRDTVYAIAASEMGEEVLKSSTATKAQKALEVWLDKQIEEQTND